MEGGGYKYLEIIEPDNLKNEEMKSQIKKEYVKSLRKILKSKLSEENIILAIISRAFSIVIKEHES